MASKWVTVTCPDECARLAKAGLLYWRWPNSSEWTQYSAEDAEWLTYYRSGWAGKDSDLWRNAGYALSRYGEGSDWPPEDFGYLVDEDEEDVSS